MYLRQFLTNPGRESTHSNAIDVSIFTPQVLGYNRVPKIPPSLSISTPAAHMKDKLTLEAITTVLGVVKDSPALFMDDVQRVLSATHGLSLFLSQISAALKSGSAAPKETTTQNLNGDQASKIRESDRQVCGNSESNFNGLAEVFENSWMNTVGVKKWLLSDPGIPYILNSPLIIYNCFI
ncbi:hypothetical protein C8R44DRAFT_723808 [Mycena epipterygia]|nr:hypothetical protein C8R44DRAFT_723808 [Mycena epipterygia]